MVNRRDDAGGHLDPLELAEHAEGLLEPARAAAVEAHVSSCDRCRELAASVAGVTTTLAGQPREVPIPEGVAARIDAALADEAASRAAPSTRESGTEGFWSRLRGRMPAIAAAAASVAVIGLVGYAVTETSGGDDADTTAEVGGDTAESGGETADAPMDAPAEAEEEAAPEADEGSEGDLDSGDESAGTQDDAGAAEEQGDDGERVEPFQEGDVSAREQDALTAELQDVVAARSSAESEENGDGGEGSDEGDPCGTALADEVGGELLGSTATDLVETGSVLVAIDLGDPETVAGWVLPDCSSGQDDALTNVKAPRE